MMYLGEVPDEIDRRLDGARRLVKDAEKRSKRREGERVVRAQYEHAAEMAESAAEMMRSYVEQLYAE